MKRVVVTGATSMIGVALINECIKNNVEVLAILRKNSSRMERLPDSELIEILECNLDELGSIQAIQKSYDVFYHFAWAYTAKNNRDDPDLQEKNIRYTLDAVELANRLGCHKFVGAGSQAEYGEQHHLIRSDTMVNPSISYGIAKYTAGKLSEKLCTRYGMVHIWGRIFSVYGRYDNEGTMLAYAIDQFIKGEIPEFSSATQMWDYLYEGDAGRIFYLLGKCIEENKVYCIANGNYRPLKEFIIELKEIFGESAKCEFAVENSGSNFVELQPEISDLVKDIGYKPAMPFKEGVLEMINYRKTHQGA